MDAPPLLNQSNLIDSDLAGSAAFYRCLG